MRRRAFDAVEKMDMPDCDPVRLERTYRQFGLVNGALSGWRRLYRQEIRPLLSAESATTLLDVGSGGGDLATRLSRWAAKDRVRLHVTGIDPDGRAHAFAAGRPPLAGVDFRQAHTTGLLREGLSFDVVISNHVLHHLQPAGLQQFLADSEALARTKVLHNDLRRSPAAYALFAVAALPFRGSFIREDGLTSIRRSYTPQELAALASPGWRVERTSAFHQMLARRKDSP
ncbi:class I SAM-dependent methyltransferase [Arthrobacter sp. S39]|uniref:class I SAM-dependent methyltransferase n=1 Tax=Arthrobacter sp. S39 TaxID=2509720 RepID=UPI0010381AB8|nr:class I SAM-dependent methyltransferase [Arthrobacter sp. S39]TAP43904.1 methyltransferase domain-containing protein [Arthrobacter sp. S39]